MIRLVVFDWDDVLVLGSKEAYFKCYYATLDALGIKLAPFEIINRILSKWGQPYKEVLRELLKENPILLRQAVKIFELHRFGKTFNSNLKPAQGLNNLLQRLNKEYILAVATGSHPEAVKFQMHKFKIPNVFSQIVSSHDIRDINKTKPDPYMILKILNKQKVKNKEAIYVGDAINDIIMGQAAKVTTVIVLSGQLTFKTAKNSGADYIINKLEEIEILLKKMNNYLNNLV